MPDRFRCGHISNDENTTYSTAKGKKYPRCLTCHTDRSRVQREKQRRAQGVPKKGEVSLAKKDPLFYLKLPSMAVEPEHSLHQAYDVARGNCDEKPAAWIDYREDEPPQRSVARAMCADCPLFNECGEFAKATKPYMGVWAGQIYQDGKVI